MLDELIAGMLLVCCSSSSSIKGAVQQGLGIKEAAITNLMALIGSGSSNSSSN